jgi:hypothetical protein
VGGKSLPTPAFARLSRRAAACALAALASAVAVPAAASAAGDTTWTVVGTGVRADTGDGGQARAAAINQPRAVAALPGGGFAWAEPYTNRVRMVTAEGVVRTIAGTGVAGSTGDGGRATDARLNFPHTAVPTADGGLLIAETRASRIRKISPAGIITTVAGTGEAGFSGDGGPATGAQINNPRSVVPLPDGGFLIPDSNNHRVRRVSASGTITTVAGTGVQGFAGDGGPATAAQLSIPFSVSPTADGGFLIADIDNARIRKVSAAGIITTVAGDGFAGFGGDGGPATAARLHHPHNVRALPDGGFLIADATNERVRRVDAGGVITTVIGDGVRSSTGDGGPASAARVAAPKDVALTASGDLLIADEQNDRIRFVGTVAIPANASPPGVSGTAAVGQQLTASSGTWRGTGPLLSYQWQRCTQACTDIPGAVATTYTVDAADNGATLRVAVTASNPAGSTTATSSPSALIGKPFSPSVLPPSTPGRPGTPTQPRGTTPPGTTPGKLLWRVEAGKTFQRAGEYVIRARTTRLADAIKAYGKPVCRAVKPRQAVATWPRRGIRVDSRADRALPRGRTGCSSPALVRVWELRLTDRRWVTSLGLHVGDRVAELRKRYPKARFVRASRASGPAQYYLVWRHERCTRACTARERRYGVDHPRLTAQVRNGRVVAFRLPVFATSQ